MKSDKQVTVIATNTLFNYFSDCGAGTPTHQRHCLNLLTQAMQPFMVLASEHELGRNSRNSAKAHKALAEINTILFPMQFADLPSNNDKT